MSEKTAKKERRKMRRVKLAPGDRRIVWAALQAKRNAPISDEEKVRELRDTLRLREAFSEEERDKRDTPVVAYTISKRAADYAKQTVESCGSWTAAALPDVKDALGRFEDGEDVDCEP
jgi:hypothetical protein